MSLGQMDVERFFMQFQDYLAPRLDTYEQAIYLYIFRHSRLIGQDEAVIPFKSARKDIALGIGEKGKPMAEGTVYEKIKSLASKECLKVLGTEHGGQRFRLSLPDEIPGIIPDPTKAISPPSIEDLDFFNVPENRMRILARENHRCFYCLRAVNSDTHVIEHVVSRPVGNNSYRNVVAGCRQCNNRKNDSSAEDFLRTLYRDGLLNQTEFEDRRSHLERLRVGELRPP